MVIVSVVLPEVLHQQLGVVQAVDVHVLLLDLSLDVPERLESEWCDVSCVAHSLSLSRLMLISWCLGLYCLLSPGLGVSLGACSLPDTVLTRCH